MNLAMFSYGLPVPGEKRGGIERAAHVLAEGLARRGHRVVVFSHDPRPAGASFEVRALPWARFVRTWVGRRVTMGYLGNLLALLPNYREFDAIIAHGDSLLLPLAGKPILRVMHGSALGEAMSARSIGRWILQMGIYPQELVTALVEAGTVAVSECARRENPFIRRVIPHGVDPAVFFPSSSDKTREPSVLFVGTLEGRKRGRLLLDIFDRVVRASRPDASLAMVGPAGPVMPGVTYHTGVSDGELGVLYRRAWLYASPSTYEGFGLPYLEAMASGTAVLATPNPGSREVLSGGRYGRLATDDAFPGALLDLLGDAPARRALEIAGLQRAQEYSLQTMIDRYETLLMELCATHARRVASV
jgi:phosphatidyl-myo-inositol alpha-mannosyltransferase